MPLPREHLMDELATAYIQILVASAGATIASGRVDYGVDGTINYLTKAPKQRSPGYKYFPSGFPVEFQLKGTSVATGTDEYITYDLNARNYDQIVARTNNEVPLYLFLICFQRDIGSWVNLDLDRLAVNAKAFWWKQTSGKTKNSSAVRLQIPTSCRLTSTSIREMLDSCRMKFTGQ